MNNYLITVIAIIFLLSGAQASTSYITSAPGDLILAPENIYITGNPDVPGECNNKSMISLKEGYMLSLYGAYFLSTPARDGMWGKEIRIANFSLYRNGEAVKESNVTDGEYFYYNKTIDGKEYTIIEFKADGIFNVDGSCYSILIPLRSFHQYSDGTGTGGQEIPSITIPPVEEWNRTFGGDHEDAIMSVQQTGDGGYFLASGFPSSWMRSYGTRIWLNRTDADGNELWNKTIFEFGTRVHSIEPTADDGFVIAGERIETGRFDMDAWLVKLDSNGGKQWSRTYGSGEYEETVYSASPISDGGYILAGSTGEHGQGIWLIRTDPNGNKKLNKILGKTTSIYHRIRSIQETTDGGYIFAKETGSDFPEYYDAQLIKVDPNGSEQWSRKFGGKYNDRFSAVRQTVDGGHIIAGMTESYGHDAWLIKTDPDGNEQWNRTFYVTGGSEGLDVQQTPDGYILAGIRFSYGDEDALLIKTDLNGSERWRMMLGGIRNDEALLVRETEDGGYILAGTTRSYGSGDKEAWMIKVSGEKTANAPLANQTEISTASPIPILTAGTSEKSAGFEVALVLMILLALCLALRNKW